LKRLYPGLRNEKENSQLLQHILAPEDPFTKDKTRKELTTQIKDWMQNNTF